MPSLRFGALLLVVLAVVHGVRSALSYNGGLRRTSRREPVPPRPQTDQAKPDQTSQLLSTFQRIRADLVRHLPAYDA